MLIYKNLLYSIELKIIAPTLFLFKQFLETTLTSTVLTFI